MYVSGRNDMPLLVVPPPVEALCGPGEAASSSPVTKTVCLHGKCGANTVHFGQDDDVVTCGWTTKHWQQKGMLMSVKNCSREVLVSRNSQQMSLGEYISKNDWQKAYGILFYWNEILTGINVA
jgi:hypothetical protein